MQRTYLCVDNLYMRRILPVCYLFQVLVRAMSDCARCCNPLAGVSQCYDGCAGRLNNWRVSMAITAALLGLSVACYLFGVLYSPWGMDFRTERQVDASPPADEVRLPMLQVFPDISVTLVHPYL